MTVKRTDTGLTTFEQFTKAGELTQTVSVEGNWFEYISSPSGNNIIVQNAAGQQVELRAGKGYRFDEASASWIIRGFVPGENVKLCVGYGLGLATDNLNVQTVIPGLVEVEGPYVAGTLNPFATLQPVVEGLTTLTGGPSVYVDPQLSLDRGSALVAKKDTYQQFPNGTQITSDPVQPGGNAWQAHDFGILQIGVTTPGWDGTLAFQMGMTNSGAFSETARLFKMDGSELAGGTITPGFQGHLYVLNTGFPYLSSTLVGSTTPPSVAYASIHGPIPFKIP